MVPVLLALSDRKALVPFNYSSRPGIRVARIGKAGPDKGRPFKPAYSSRSRVARSTSSRAIRRRAPNHIKLDVTATLKRPRGGRAYVRIRRSGAF